MQPWDIGSSSRRSGGIYIPFKYKSIKFNNSFFPYFTKLWNALGKKQKSLNLQDFKQEMKKHIKPPRYKHLGRGNKYACKLLTQIRVGNSFVKSRLEMLTVTYVFADKLKTLNIILLNATCILFTDKNLFHKWNNSFLILAFQLQKDNLKSI